MPSLEIPLNPELIAERGYNAFADSVKQMSDDLKMPYKQPVPDWNSANANLRNFWRAWAREFIRLNMGINT